MGSAHVESVGMIILYMYLTVQQIESVGSRCTGCGTGACAAMGCSHGHHGGAGGCVCHIAVHGTHPGDHAPLTVGDLYPSRHTVLALKEHHATMKAIAKLGGEDREHAQ